MEMHCMEIQNNLGPDGNITGGFVKGIGLAIEWQDGLMVDGIQTGALVEDVLRAALCRLQAYNDTSTRCRESSLAVTKIEEALHWLKARREDRVERGVVDTYAP